MSPCVIFSGRFPRKAIYGGLLGNSLLMLLKIKKKCYTIIYKYKSPTRISKIGTKIMNILIKKYILIFEIFFKCDK